jgi:hypothetical protein
MVQKIADLKSESKRLFNEALQNQGDKSARWQRSLELNNQVKLLREEANSLTGPIRLEIESDLLEIEGWLIFLLSDLNKPDELLTESETLEQAVRRLYAESYELAKNFALNNGDRSAMQQRGTKQEDELLELLKRGGRDDPEMQRLLSEASLDIDYVVRGGNSPTSTRLAYYLMELRK